MRCLSCNKALGDFESTRKSVETGEYIDMCNNCFSHVAKNVVTHDRADLQAEDEIVGEADQVFDRNE
jgi:hypothetical protein